jgi:hypothetical protein
MNPYSGRNAPLLKNVRGGRAPVSTSGFPEVGNGLGGAPRRKPSLIERLFRKGEQGALYDPSVLTSVFQERTGAAATTPSTVGGVVGTLRDLSGRGNHATAPSDAARPLLMVDDQNHYYLLFNGSTSQMVHSLTGKVSVSAGVSRPDAAEPTYRGIYATASNPAGTLMLLGLSSTLWGSFGTQAWLAISLTTGQKYVLTMDGTDSGVFRTDGTPGNSYGNTIGQENGHIGGSSTQLGAFRLYGLVARETAFGDDLSFVEKYLAKKSGITLP